MNVAITPIRNAPGAATSGDRSIGPDLIRAIAALMVVYLHACVPYLTHPMPGLVWPVMDEASGICDLLFWSIEIVVMPLFLVISGFYAYKSLAGTDWQSFLQSRTRRLIRPLLFGMIVILPIDLYIWMAGLIAEGHMPLAKMRSLKVPSPYGDNLWGLSHLWFLMYVFLYGVVMVAAAHQMRHGIPMRLRPTVRRLSIISILTLGALTLVASPEVVFGFQHAFMPVFSKWLYSGTFFAGGIAIAVFDPSFRIIDRLAVRHLSLGAIATVAAVLLGRWTLRTDFTRFEASHWLVSISLAVTTVAAAWCVTLGAIGIANRSSTRILKYSRACRMIRYVTGASFWIYLVHHPIVGLAHIDLKWLTPGLWPAAKSLIAFGIAVAWGLMSYEIAVRRARFGQFFGFTSLESRKPVADQTGNAVTPERVAIRRAA